MNLEQWTARLQRKKEQKKLAAANQILPNQSNLFPTPSLIFMQTNNPQYIQQSGQSQQNSSSLKPSSSQKSDPQIKQKQKQLQKEKEKEKEKEKDKEKQIQKQKQKQILQAKQINQKQNLKQLQIQKPQIKYFSQNILPNKPALDQQAQSQKQKMAKMTRILLKDVDKIKQTILNVESTLKGLEYIKNRMKSDRLFYKKIKAKIKQIKGSSKYQQIN